jgi:cytochrome P450
MALNKRLLTPDDELDSLLTSPSFYDDPYPVYRLLQHEDPVHWCQPWQQWWCAIRRELMPSAIEELLRFEGPVQRVRRVASVDTELGGRAITRGQPVLAFLGAANRDARAFDDPDRLDVRRDPKHVTFGHGIHFCVVSPNP